MNICPGFGRCPRTTTFLVVGFILSILSPCVAVSQPEEKRAALVMAEPDRVLSDAIATKPSTTVSIDGRDPTHGTVVVSGGKNLVLHLAFAPNRNRLLTGRYRGELDFWDTETWTKVRSIRTGHDRVTALTVSRDGRLAATGGDDLMVRIWDIDTGALVTKIPGCKDYPDDIAFSSDGHLIATSVNGWPDFVYDLSKRSVTKELKANGVAFPASSDTLITTMAQELIVWDVKNWEVSSQMPDPGGSMRAVAVDHERNRVATGSFRKDGTKLWDLATRKMLVHFPSGYTASLAISADGRWLFTGGDGFIRLWSIDSGQEMCSSKALGLWEIQLSPDGRWLAAGVDSGVQLWGLDKVIRNCRAETEGADQ